MRRCILNVTVHEYDQILQFNHDSAVWTRDDHVLFDQLRPLIGDEIASQIMMFDECVMEKHNDMSGMPRIRCVQAI